MGSILLDDSSCFVFQPHLSSAHLPTVGIGVSSEDVHNMFREAGLSLDGFDYKQVQIQCFSMSGVETNEMILS